MARKAKNSVAGTWLRWPLVSDQERDGAYRQLVSEVIVGVSGGQCEALRGGG
jgi:hypothetical protein